MSSPDLRCPPAETGRPSFPRQRSAGRTAMTIGDLARRTGVPVKVLRRHEDMGLIHTLGRSPAGYRIFGEDALWCVETIGTLRSLGLTEAEIRHLAHSADRNDEGCQLIGPQLAEVLRRVRARTESRIRQLEQLQWRVENFERRHRSALDGRCVADPVGPDPTRAEAGLDSPTGGRP